MNRWQVRRNRETILKDAASVYPVRLADFDKDPYLYNCLNGTLDLRTREFRPHSPADMLSIIAKVRYIPEARSELWERVIWEAMQGDMGKIAFLQKAMGYGLTGGTAEECFFIDDLHLNVEAARWCGMRAFHYQNDISRLRAALREAGIPVASER